ncbi:hypothetical protein PENSPDRAFT_693586 [Peniophora sp. CONT]|nr:hypothetical protein PENSPDRAFT_693586 [Peniophora sp. CONT]
MNSPSMEERMDKEFEVPEHPVEDLLPSPAYLPMWVEIIDAFPQDRRTQFAHVRQLLVAWQATAAQGIVGPVLTSFSPTPEFERSMSALLSAIAGRVIELDDVSSLASALLIGMFGNLFALYAVSVIGPWAEVAFLQPADDILRGYRTRLAPVLDLCRFLVPRCRQALPQNERTTVMNMMWTVFLSMGRVRRTLTTLMGFQFFSELQGEGSSSPLEVLYGLIEQQTEGTGHEVVLLALLTPAEQMAGMRPMLEGQLAWVERLRVAGRVSLERLDLSPAQTVALRDPAAQLAYLQLETYCWHCHATSSPCHPCTGCRRARYCVDVCSKQDDDQHRTLCPVLGRVSDALLGWMDDEKYAGFQLNV